MVSPVGGGVPPALPSTVAEVIGSAVDRLVEVLLEAEGVPALERITISPGSHVRRAVVRVAVSGSPLTRDPHTHVVPVADAWSLR